MVFSLCCPPIGQKNTKGFLPNQERVFARPFGTGPYSVCPQGLLFLVCTFCSSNFFPPVLTLSPAPLTAPGSPRMLENTLACQNLALICYHRMVFPSSRVSYFPPVYLIIMQVFETKSDKEKVKRKRKKKDDDEKEKDKPARRPSNASSNTTSTTETEIPKKRRRKDKAEKATKVKQEEIVDVEEDDDDDDDDDDDEICASSGCTRPQGDEVGWVQCDICEKWYHLACVGLSPEKAEAMDSYNCRLCTGGGSSTNSAVGTPAAASPESENIDVDGTTPSATTPTSPSPPVCLVDVEGTDATQQQENESENETALASVIQNTAAKPCEVATIDLCSDTEDAEGDADVDVETGITERVAND